MVRRRNPPLGSRADLTARRFAPNRPYRVTFNGGVHGPADNAYCQAVMPPAGRAERALSRGQASGQAREITTDLVLVYASSASGPDSRP